MDVKVGGWMSTDILWCFQFVAGSNCWLNGHIIKAGRVVDGDDGHMYKCPKGRLPLWLRHHGRQAMCVDCFV